MRNFWGLGVDVLRTSRIHQILSSKSSNKFLRRVLSDSEMTFSSDLIENHKENPQKLDQLCQFVANRWAAKEAMVKALNKKDLEFRKVSVEKTESGKPQVVLDHEYLIELGNPLFELSVSHETDITVVVALCFKD